MHLFVIKEDSNLDIVTVFLASLGTRKEVIENPRITLGIIRRYIRFYRTTQLLCPFGLFSRRPNSYY